MNCTDCAGSPRSRLRRGLADRDPRRDPIRAAELEVALPAARPGDDRHVRGAGGPGGREAGRGSQLAPERASDIARLASAAAKLAEVGGSLPEAALWRVPTHTPCHRPRPRPGPRCQARTPARPRASWGSSLPLLAPEPVQGGRGRVQLGRQDPCLPTRRGSSGLRLAAVGPEPSRRRVPGEEPPTPERYSLVEDGLSFAFTQGRREGPWARTARCRKGERCLGHPKKGRAGPAKLGRR